MLDLPASPAAPRLLEVHEVAYHLRCSQETVRRLVRDRKLAAVHLGTHWRIDQADLRFFIDSQRTAIAREERALDARLHPVARGGNG